MGEYEESSEWADVVPIPQNEGGRHPLAAISYTEEYSEATSYLRAVMADNEMSERVLKLTEHIISMNPAHYTVWYAVVSDVPAQLSSTGYTEHRRSKASPMTLSKS
jgi:hypothetical protein